MLDKLSEKFYLSRFWEGEQGFYKRGGGGHFPHKASLYRRLKDLLDFTCMIADKFSKDAKVKLTLFQNIG